MNSIMFLIMFASFGIIGSVLWARKLNDAFVAKKDWIWPLITGILALIVSICASFAWEYFVHDAPVKLHPFALWPLLFMATLACIQLGYDVVIKTFLKLIEGLGNIVDGAGRAVEGIGEKIEQ